MRPYAHELLQIHRDGPRQLLLFTDAFFVLALPASHCREVSIQPQNRMRPAISLFHFSPVLMPTCNQCGGEIVFRVIDGHARPIHVGGGWGCGSDSSSVGFSGWPTHPTRPPLHAVYRLGLTYVNPNARCPVCGVDVYYYQSPDDGRVFFDELGPPWPKHACTDQASITRRFAAHWTSLFSVW